MQERDLSGLLPVMVLAFGLSACAITETGPSRSGSGDGKPAEIARSSNLPACSFNRTREDKKTATFKNYSDAANKHVIVIHSETNQSKIERGDGELPTYEEQFKAVMEGYLEWRKDRGNEQGRMLLFFNGGLNATKFTKDAAVGQIACIKKDRVYPVYMIWSSGIVATYGEQSAYVRNGLLNKDLQPTTPL